MSLLIKIAFKRLNLLNLRSIHVESHPLTSHLIKLFKFKKAGILKEYFFYNNKYVDMVITQLKRADWQKVNNK